jgi:hypothetical protein
MKLKSLLPLVVIVVILAVLVGVKKVKERPKAFVEQVGLVSLLPEGVSKGDLAKFELYVGAKPDQKVVLAMESGSDKWRVASQFNAPVKQEKIKEFLEAASGLQGEFRSTAGSDADLEPFNLTNEKAFHVLAYKKDSDTPAYHVLVGSTPGMKSVFMRADGTNDVFVEDSNLRQLAGLYGDDMEKAPEADPWFDNQVLDLNKEEITKIALKSPDKELVFELQPKPGEPQKEETPAESQKEGEGEENAEKKEAPKPPTEYQWVLAKGGPGGAHKQGGLDSLLRKLDSLTSNGIVDPSKKAEWGLDPAGFSCVVSFKEEKPEVTIEGGRPESDGDGYVRVATNTEDIVYKLSKYSFNQLWPKGADFFDLPKLQLDAATLDRIEVKEPEGKIVLARKDSAWTVVEPVADLAVQNSTLDTVGRTLAAWKAEDYADSPGGCELDAPQRTVTFKTASGESHTVVVGGKSKYFDGAYARLDGKPEVLAMGKMDVDKVFVPPKNLFDRRLFDFGEEDITSVQVRRKDDTFLVERKDDNAWSVTIEGTSYEGDSTACEELFSGIAQLEATDILFGKTSLKGELSATIGLTRKAGGGATITIGPETGGAHTVALEGKKQLFSIETGEIAPLLPTGNSLKKPEPPPAPETSAAPESTEQQPTPETGETPETTAAPEGAANAPESPPIEVNVTAPSSDTPAPPAAK